MNQEIPIAYQEEYTGQQQVTTGHVHQQITETRFSGCRCVIAPNQEQVVLFESELEGNGPRELVNLLLEKNIRVGAVFCGNEEAGYRYVIGSKSVDVRSYANLFRQLFEGKGGGKPEMVQGTLKGTEETIKEAMETCKNESH